MSKSRTEVDDTPLAPAGAEGWDGRSEAALATPEPQRKAAEAAVRKGVRRGPADPVKALLHRHRELCERAVDPLEIAAGLEAHGVTDRVAARYRHRDVFALAEEMYARVPRDGARTGSVLAPPDDSPAHDPLPAGWAFVALLPGIVGAAAVAGYELTAGRGRLTVLVAGFLVVAVTLRFALRHGPLRTRGRTVRSTRAWTGFLLLYALGGDGLVQAALTGGPDEPWPLDTAALLGLALAFAPAAWCARLFAARARRRLAQSRGLAEFAAGARPLLLAVVVLYTALLAGLLVLAGRLLGAHEPPVGAALLGVTLLLARLLTAYGFARAPAVVLGWACAVEGLAVAAAFGARLPGCDFLAVPLDTVGAGAVPVIACGAAAAALLLWSTRRLTRASAHADVPGERG